MKRLARLVGLCGFLVALAPTSLLAEDSVLEYKGARLGYTSETDLVFDIPPTMTGEELLELANGAYSRLLRPIAAMGPFTVAQRRLLLICCYANLCHWSALWTGLICRYEQDKKESYYGCGANFSELTGYLVDVEKLSRIRQLFHMRQFIHSNTYAEYVKGFTDTFLTPLFQDDKTKQSIPTDADIAIIRKVLSDTALDRSTNLLYLEDNFDKTAIGWDNYLFLLRNQSLGTKWVALRRYYQEQLRTLLDYKNTFDAQTRLFHADLSTQSVARQLDQAWGNIIETTRVRLHRCVYDAPYCLLVTNFCRLLEPASSWIHTEHNIVAINNYLGNFSARLGDSDDMMRNVTTTLAVTQTGRLIRRLKDKMGTSAYNAAVEQNKLLRQLIQVASGEE